MKTAKLFFALSVAASHLIAFGDIAPAIPPGLDDPDPVVKLRNRAEVAAIVVLVEAEPTQNQTRFKIVEFWKRKAPEGMIAKYFGNNYLAFVYPSQLQAGQRILAFYFLPSQDWNSPTDSPLVAGMINDKFRFNQHSQTEPAQEYSAPDFRKLLSNDKKPFVFPAALHTK